MKEMERINTICLMYLSYAKEWPVLINLFEFITFIGIFVICVGCWTLESCVKRDGRNETIFLQTSYPLNKSLFHVVGHRKRQISILLFPHLDEKQTTCCVVNAEIDSTFVDDVGSAIDLKCISNDTHISLRTISNTNTRHWKQLKTYRTKNFSFIYHLIE